MSRYEVASFLLKFTNMNLYLRSFIQLYREKRYSFLKYRLWLFYFYSHVFLCISMSLSLPAAFWQSSSVWSYNWFICPPSGRGCLSSSHTYYLIHIFSLHYFLVFNHVLGFASGCSYVLSFSQVDFWCFFCIFGLCLSAMLLQIP